MITCVSPTLGGWRVRLGCYRDPHNTTLGVLVVLDSVSFRYAELFAGIGGLGAGFEAVGGECVYANDHDKYAAVTYQANNPSIAVDTRDVRAVRDEDVPDHDVLLAGFPCQPFSVAGISKRRALGRATGMACQDQGNLFYEAARIIAAKKPRAVVLENVKNLLRHDRGRTLDVIGEMLHDLGYGFRHRILDAAAWVPQHRERIFIVALSGGDECDLANVPVPTEAIWPTMRAVLHQADGKEDVEPPYTHGRSRLRVAPKYTLSAHMWRYLQAYKRKHQGRGNGFGFGMVGLGDRARTLSARYYKDGSEILVRRRGGNPRRLTPRECARLMGFDSGRESAFRIPVSDNQAYRQFGNAVAVPVAKALATSVVRCL